MGQKSSRLQERRDARRVDVRVPVHLGRADGSAESQEAVTYNISRNGAYCTVRGPVDLFTKLRVTLLLPDPAASRRRGRSSPIECTGIVVRREPVDRRRKRSGEHLAIFFEEMEEEDRLRIDRFLSDSAANARNPSAAPAASSGSP